MRPTRCLFPSLLPGCLLLAGQLFASPAKKPAPDADFYLKPYPTPGQTLSDIAYRVIAVHAEGIDDAVVTIPATGTLTFLPSNSPDSIKWTTTARMDGRMALKDAPGEYRDHGTTMCFQGECHFTTDASGPFYNPTLWGTPQGTLSPGQSWAVELKQPWELGPAGKQTVTVLSVDTNNGIVVLKREGEALGSYEGAQTSITVKKDGKPYKVDVKYGLAHWSGQAVFRRGVVVSDELLCVTSLELTSPELGVIHATERQYMSLLEHPDPIAG